MPKRKAPAGTRAFQPRKRKPWQEKMSPWWSEPVAHLSQATRNFEPGYTAALDLQPKQKAKAKKRVRTTSNRKDLQRNLTRCVRIRLLPTDAQKQQFHQWFGIHRKFWNKTADLLNAGDRQKWTEQRKIVWELPELAMYKDNKLAPYDMRAGGVHAAATSHAASRESLKEKKKDPDSFSLRHLTKNDATQQFKINGGASRRPACRIKDGAVAFWLTRKIGDVKVKRQSDLAKLASFYPSLGIPCGSTLHYEKPGRYHLIVPIVKVTPEPKPVTDIMATDPGVRTFHTTFDSNGYICEELVGEIERIVTRCLSVERWMSQLDLHMQQTTVRDKRFCNVKQRLKKKIALMRLKIFNIKRDFHWKLAKQWCNEYSDIIIPKFNVSQMVTKFARKIKKITVRKMMHWSHFQFRQRLISKAAEVGSRVHEVDEKYTTKTCHRCGNMREMGGSKVYICHRPGCGYKGGRDENSAINIFIKNFDLCIESQAPSLPRREGRRVCHNQQQKDSHSNKI